jgi:hypothetical protein
MVKSCDPCDYPQFGRLSPEIMEKKAYSFWIAKLQPFCDVPPENAKAKQANDVNAIIAVRLLCRTVNSIRKTNGKRDLDQLNLSNLIHAFRYRDISKEAVMAIFENLIRA